MTDPITRLNAALEGRYRIERELGEGGMATVYLARDEKHNRNVALKVLKPELAAVVGAERFLAEIETTANLQHPHILPLFDSGEADSFLFYVMPYVEGESLRERLDREHQLPVAEAVQIATNVAEALDYAHRQGVIHRDIKPANILLQAGKPVVSDFGIALAVGAAGGGRLTETGLSLGTPHYMSPEQATGDLGVGAATDIYALGCVLYEMLVGEPPYTGGTAQAILGKIVTGDADPVTQHRKSVPANVEAAIRKSLEKVPADRFAGAEELARALGDPGFRHGAVAGVASTSGWQARATGPLSYAAMAALALVAIWGWLRPSGTAPPTVTRVMVQMDSTQSRAGGGSLDVSPDGTFIVYHGRDGDGTTLWLRRWSSLGATPVPNTEGGGSGIAISPDQSEAAFVQGGALIVQPLDGGQPRQLTPPGTAFGRSKGVEWDPSAEWIYFQHTTGFGISRVRASGGEIEPVTATDSVFGFHDAIEVLPGGHAAVLMRNGLFRETSELVALDLQTGETSPLFEGANATYRSGFLFFESADGAELYAVPFDADAVAPRGTPVLVTQGMWEGRYGLGQDGTLVYTVPGTVRPTLEWIARDGSRTPTDDRLGLARSPSISPDGRRVAVELDGGISVWDPFGGTISQIASPGGTTYRPSWHPDGTSVLFASNGHDPGAVPEMYSVPADGSAQPALLGLESADAVYAGGSEWLVYRTSNTDVGMGAIYAIPSDLTGPPIEIIDTPNRDWHPTVSLNGRWVAYATARSAGNPELYVTSFPEPGARVLVSTGGGVAPRWSKTGNELFYVRSGDRVMEAVSYVEEPTFRVTGREELFQYPSNPTAIGRIPYDVTVDDRFLVPVRPTGDTDVFRTVLVRNVFAEIEAAASN